MKIDRGFWVIELWRDTVEIKCRQEVYFEKIIKVFFFFFRGLQYITQLGEDVLEL